MIGWDAYEMLDALHEAQTKRLSAAIGHMMNAQFALEGGGTKREAIDILKRGIAIAMARDSAETACPAPVHKDCQARAGTASPETHNSQRGAQ